jgi:hypothetical protein
VADKVVDILPLLQKAAAAVPEDSKTMEPSAARQL